MEDAERDEHVKEIGLLLDEVYALRALCAEQVSVVNRVLEYKTLPYGAAKLLDGVRLNCTILARGGANIDFMSTSERYAHLEAVGASPLLTRAMFRQSVGLSPRLHVY